MMLFSENTKFSMLYSGLANAVACDIVDTTNFHHGAFVIIHEGSADTDLTLTLNESDDVAGSSTAAISTAVPLFVDTDMGTTSDTLVRQTDAYTYTIDTTAAGDRSQMVVFEIDPAILSSGFPCVYLSDSGGNVANYCTVLWVGQPRHLSASLPSAIA